MEPEEYQTITEEDISRVQHEIEQIDHKLAAHREKSARTKGELQHLTLVNQQQKELEMKLNQKQREINIEKTNIETLRLLLFLLEKERANLDKNIIVPIQQRIQEEFKKLTVDRYAEIMLNSDFSLSSLKLKTYDNNYAQVDNSMLSFGTREQLSFILRYAIAQYLSAKEPQVLVLDDSFVNTDSERLKSIFTMMQEWSKKIQFIILTCKYKDYAPFKEKAHYLDLDQVLG